MTVILTVICGLGAAVVGGLFFAFSSFVMQGLARLSPREGVAAMQMINVTVMNPVTMGAFFGTGVLCLGLAIYSIVTTSGIFLVLSLTGSALYVVGCIMVTGTRNVPLNDRLAAVEADSDEARSLWRIYLVRWMWWNHVRTAACVASSVCLIVAAIVG